MSDSAPRPLAVGLKYSRTVTVTITDELTEIDRRRLGFRVEVRDELDEAGKGTHERFIVDGAQRLPRLQDKMNRWKAAGGKPA